MSAYRWWMVSFICLPSVGAYQPVSTSGCQPILLLYGCGRPQRNACSVAPTHLIRPSLHGMPTAALADLLTSRHADRLHSSQNGWVYPRSLRTRLSSSMAV